MDTLFNVEDEVQAALNELGILTKIDEMDDFMNQNELKVTITNENAVVTGLVTYTCTVKDKNNNNLPGRVVEWYKGTTLLGIDATDSNGVSTFSHRVTEADIYDVHAVVRGTHAGDDIRMFVKDKDNLSSFNLWSCGEYLNNFTDITITSSHSQDYTISTEESQIGDKCLKMIKPSDLGTYSVVSFNIPISQESIGKSFNYSSNIKNNGASLIQLYANSSSFISNINYVPSSTEWVSVNGSVVIPDDTTVIQVRIFLSNSNETSVMYLDNIDVSIS